jgi:hypothetical protein
MSYIDRLVGLVVCEFEDGGFREVASAKRVKKHLLFRCAALHREMCILESPTS